MIPENPITQTVAAEAKWVERRAQITLTPSTRQVSLDASHSLSGSHLSDRHAAKSCMASVKLAIAPKAVMTREANLLYPGSISLTDSDMRAARERRPYARCSAHYR